MANRLSQLMLLVMALALCACGVAAPAATLVTVSTRRVAQRDAQKLLHLAVLPPGAVRLSAEPRGDGGLLRGPSTDAGYPHSVDRYDWWRVPAGVDSVLAFIKAHRPRGGHSSGRLAVGGPGGPRNGALMFSFPAVKRVISMRWLTFDAVALPGGSTGVRVDAQDLWIVARPASEKVPAHVREVDVTSALPGKAPFLSRRVTSAAKIHRILTLLDAMEIVQPGVAYSCPAFPGDHPVVTFDFRATAGGRLLARARLTDADVASGPCNPVDFSIDGHRQTPLIGSDFVKQTERLLRVNLLAG
jgi:hypothetical protein